MALPAVNTSQAVTGGIGEGLKSFATAYQTALNYQLQKQQAADLAAYQSQMADVAARNATSTAVGAGAEAIKSGGSPYAGPQLEKLGLNPIEYPPTDEQPPQTSNDASQQQAPLAPQPGALEQGPGFMGPPRPPGLMPPQAQIQGPNQAPTNGILGPNVGPGRGGFQGGGWPPKGMIPSEAQNAMAAQLRNEAMTKNTNEGMSGEHYTPDFNTMTLVRSEVPLSQSGALERSTKEQQLKNDTANQRSANNVPMTQYNDNESTKDARASAVPMNQVIQLLSGKNPTDAQKQAAFMAATRVLDPHVAEDAKNPQDALANSQGISARVISLLNEAAGKGITPEVLNSAVQAAQSVQMLFQHRLFLLPYTEHGLPPALFFQHS